MALFQVAQYVQNHKPDNKLVNLTILDLVSKNLCSQ